jgi:ribosome-binding factor A
MLAGKRSVRVGEQILKEIAQLLLESVRDPRVRGATMTGIHLSNDLRSAKVYYSIYGEKEMVARTQAGLDSAKGYIKREIARRMALKYVPAITFIHDSSLETGSRIENLLDEL